MSRIAKFFRAEVSLWPFQWIGAVVFPLVIMSLGSYRVWATAATPYEEMMGITANVSLTLLWSLVFGRALPDQRRSSEAA
jgi:hypothetical protein